MKRVNRYQGGSILTFIVVAVVVAALLIGGVFWLRQRGEIAREAAKVTVNRDVPPKQEASQKSDDKKDTAKTPVTDKRESSEESKSQPSQLPETGPTEAVLSIFALAVLAYAVTRYISSRSELTRALSLPASL